MKRVALTDGSGKWFNRETAEIFEEATEHDGHNLISRATGSQWYHEALYRTAGGRWVLNHWGGGGGETYREIGGKEAAAWLVRNGHTYPGAEADIEALEI